jgi:hypothetical protein
VIVFVIKKKKKKRRGSTSHKVLGVKLGSLIEGTLETNIATAPLRPEVTTNARALGFIVEKGK